MPDHRPTPLHRRATAAARTPWELARRWWQSWRQLGRLSAQVLVLALSPGSYRRGGATGVARTIYAATAPLLTGFGLLSALLGLVVIRIVLATALSYGLSRYALDVLVRTLVLELIPLSAALFVAVRYALPAGDEARRLRGGAAGSVPWLRRVVLPRTLAALFAVLALALLSGVLVLVLTYLSIYGFSSWGLPGFTRNVGQVFNPVVGLIFGLKTLAFGLAVALVPVMEVPPPRAGRVVHAGYEELSRLTRLLLLLLAVELLSLVGNYA